MNLVGDNAKQKPCKGRFDVNHDDTVKKVTQPPVLFWVSAFLLLQHRGQTL